MGFGREVGVLGGRVERVDGVGWPARDRSDGDPDEFTLTCWSFKQRAVWEGGWNEKERTKRRGKRKKGPVSSTRRLLSLHLLLLHQQNPEPKTNESLTERSVLRKVLTPHRRHVLHSLHPLLRSLQLSRQHHPSFGSRLPLPLPPVPLHPRSRDPSGNVGSSVGEVLVDVGEGVVVVDLVGSFEGSVFGFDEVGSADASSGAVAGRERREMLGLGGER